MTPASELRLLRRLAAPGTVVVPDGPDAWSAVPHGDRRRRALARLTAAEVRALTAAGTLSDGEARTLTEEGRKRLARLREGGSANPFAAQHRRMALRRTDDASVAVNLAESPLARLGRAHPVSGEAVLSPAEIQAGERLRQDLARSTYNARTTMDWSAPPPGRTPARSGGRDPAGAADAALAARDRVNAALEFVGSPFSTVLLDLLWREISLEAIERSQKWPPRTGRLGVKLALGRLAQHYGFVADPPS